MKLFSRQEFKEQVSKRHSGLCEICFDTGKDAHHIVARKKFKNGGYYLDNGIFLCWDCHRLAEYGMLSSTELRAAAGIKNIILPTPYEGLNDSRFRDI